MATIETPPRRATTRRVATPLAAAVVAVVAVPFLLGSFTLGLVALWLPFVLLAISLDILWGENRIVSFGHGAFFAAGGYTAGLLLRGPAADTSQTNFDLLSGDAGRSSFDELVETLAAPAISGIPVLALVLPVVLCGTVGFLVGLAVFRTGSPEVYAPLITLGVGVIAATAFLKIPEIGGSNGLSGVPPYTDEITTNRELGSYVFNAVWVGVAYLAYWAWRTRRSGRRWRASGDDPLRLEAFGVAVARRRAVGFGVSCAIAGVAGALYVGSSGFMSADTAGVLFSVQALIWLAVGGPGLLLAPLIGVLAVQGGGHYLSQEMQETWQLLLGIVLIVVVLAAPRGLAGALDDTTRLIRTRLSHRTRSTP